MGATTRCLCLTLLTLLTTLLTGEAAGQEGDFQPITTTDRFSYEEIATSLVVNQLAILQLMATSSNASSCTGINGTHNNQVGTDEHDEAAVEAKIDEVLSSLEAKHHHMLEAINATNTATLQHVVEALRREVGQASTTTELPPDATTPAVTTSEYTGPTLHNDTFISLCENTNKVLYGTFGALAVVKSGNYGSSRTCYWEIVFPKESTVSLSWDYIDMEEHKICTYDWIEIYKNVRVSLDSTPASNSSQLVYGRRLCSSSTSPSLLNLLNVKVSGVRDLKVSFRSDGSNEGRGFTLRYEAQ